VDHVLIFGERHLHRILAVYSSYYNETRTHLALGKDVPLRQLFKNRGPLLPRQFCPGCIIDTSGHDFREGQATAKEAMTQHYYSEVS
jgi:hypothetical protein